MGSIVARGHFFERSTECRIVGERAEQLIVTGPRFVHTRDNRVDDAQSFFRDANGLAPNDPRINTEWGELFLEKYNKAEAAKSIAYDV